LQRNSRIAVNPGFWGRSAGLGCLRATDPHRSCNLSDTASYGSPGACAANVTAAFVPRRIRHGAELTSTAMSGVWKLLAELVESRQYSASDHYVPGR
jgi:hypothetical protein